MRASAEELARLLGLDLGSDVVVQRGTYSNTLYSRPRPTAEPRLCALKRVELDVDRRGRMVHINAEPAKQFYRMRSARTSCAQLSPLSRGFDAPDEATAVSAVKALLTVIADAKTAAPGFSVEMPPCRTGDCARKTGFEVVAGLQPTRIREIRADSRAGNPLYVVNFLPSEQSGWSWIVTMETDAGRPVRVRLDAEIISN